MEKHDIEQYRETLLRAGLGYRRVQRHVRELQDHYDDLQRQALARGLAAEAAASEARNALGDLALLAREMVAGVTKSVWHRHPVWLVVLLPALAYVLLFVPLILLCALPILLAEHALTSVAMRDLLLGSPVLDFIIWQQTWVVLPLFACAVVWLGLRNRLPRRHVVAGALLLCLVGSGTRMALQVPDAEHGVQGMLAFYLAYDMIPGVRMQAAVAANSWRLLLNLALVGGFAGSYLWRERRRMLEWKR